MRKSAFSTIAALLLPICCFGKPGENRFDFATFAKGEPAVTALSALIMDERTGKILWSKDADAPRYPASTTKIMTAMLLVELCRPDEVITAPADVEKVTEASLNLKPGERLSAKDMLYALLIRSANDGAYTVARHISGSVERFAELMNARAFELGCTHTNFKNPHGLNNKEHMTTAHDLAIIARAAMRYPDFREAARARKHEIKRSVNTKDGVLVTKNKWFKKDPTADGIKTGFTNPAGRCFVGSATRNGYRLITVVLKSANWQDDNKAMLEWAYKNHERAPLAPAGAVVGVAAVDGGESDQVRASLPVQVDTIVRKGEPIGTSAVHLELKSPIRAPIVRGQPIGQARYTDATGFEQIVPLVALHDVRAKPALLAAATSYRNWLVVGAMAWGWSRFAKRKARRQRRRRATMQMLSVER